MARLVPVLCVSRKRPELLAKCFGSCLRQDYPDNGIVVVLNPEEPATEAELRRRFCEVYVLRTHRNIGFFPVWTPE